MQNYLEKNTEAVYHLSGRLVEAFKELEEQFNPENIKTNPMKENHMDAINSFDYPMVELYAMIEENIDMQNNRYTFPPLDALGRFNELGIGYLSQFDLQQLNEIGRKFNMLVSAFKEIIDKHEILLENLSKGPLNHQELKKWFETEGDRQEDRIFFCNDIIEELPLEGEKFKYFAPSMIRIENYISESLDSYLQLKEPVFVIDMVKAEYFIKFIQNESKALFAYALSIEKDISDAISLQTEKTPLTDIIQDAEKKLDLIKDNSEKNKEASAYSKYNIDVGMEL